MEEDNEGNSQTSDNQEQPKIPSFSFQQEMDPRTQEATKKLEEAIARAQANVTSTSTAPEDDRGLRKSKSMLPDSHIDVSQQEKQLKPNRFLSFRRRKKVKNFFSIFF